MLGHEVVFSATGTQVGARCDPGRTPRGPRSTRRIIRRRRRANTLVAVSAWERLLAWEDQHRFAVDSAITGLTLLLLLPMAATGNTGVFGTGPIVAVPWDYSSNVSTGLATLTVLAITVPLAWRRVNPALSAGLVYGAILLQMLLGPALLLPVDFLVLVSLYSVTVHGPRWARRVAIWGAVAGAVLLGVLVSRRDDLDAFASTAYTVFALLTFLVVWALALVRRSRLLRIEALVDRARQAEIDRDQQSRLATAAERARIAREMHDIVAHSLSVVIAQADGGRYASSSDPEAATRALATISDIGRAALTDMRRLLGVLRTEDGAGRDDAPGVLPGTGSVPVVTPQPAEGDLEDLVAQLRETGMNISFARVGQPRNLPPGAGLTVYRIAQESLTNVLKHAGPAPHVTVLLAWTPGSVVLEVADDGRGAAADSDGNGHGLVGMRERTTMFGGTLVAGPRPGGGFRVRAEIPTPNRTPWRAP